MGNEVYIYIGIGAAVFFLLLYFALTARKRQRRQALYRIRRFYGQTPEREYTEDELQKIRTFFDLTKEEERFYIDDISWNDLDMDGLFMAANHCFSSCGEEELYRLLRTPVLKPGELEKREQLIRFFDGNTDVREALELQYAFMGRTKKFSIIQYLRSFRDLPLKSGFHHAFHMILLLAAIGTIFIIPLLGILVLLVVMGINIYRYYSEKSSIEPYYVSLSAIAYLITSAEKITEVKAPELEPYHKELREALKPVRSLTRDMFFLGSGTQSTGGGDLLQIIMDYLRMITHLDFLKFNTMVRKIASHEAELLKILEICGFLEAMISVSSFRRTLPFYCTPDLTETKEVSLSVKDGYHPLLREPVANSFDTDRPMLITGSNASGKSTFLKMTALNLIFGESLNTCFAAEVSGPFCRVYSSMALRDDITGGESYYVVEVRSIKRILDALHGETPVVAFVDEILRGTNTVERIAASSEVLKYFADHGAMVFAATHDIELTYLLEEDYKNAHFTEDVEDGEISFSYQLKEGRASSRNAIKLLSVMGYDDEVVTRAEETAQRFLKEGEWRLS